MKITKENLVNLGFVPLNGFIDNFELHKNGVKVFIKKDVNTDKFFLYKNAKHLNSAAETIEQVLALVPEISV
jgi:hypothetical protein